MSIQPAFNHCKTVPYVCSYLSETECSPTMIQAVIQAFKKELENYEQTKFIAKMYLNKWECSVQETLHHILQAQK